MVAFVGLCKVPKIPFASRSQFQGLSFPFDNKTAFHRLRVRHRFIIYERGQVSSPDDMAAAWITYGCV